MSQSSTLIGDYFWSKLQQDQTIFEGVRAQKIPKGAISWMLNQYKKKLKILISQPHMLYWWILPHIYLNKVFQLAKFWGAYHRVYEGVNEKSLKMNKKINFLAQIWPYLNTSKNCSIFDTSSCLSPPVKKCRLLLESSYQKSTQK